MGIAWIRRDSTRLRGKTVLAMARSGLERSRKGDFQCGSNSRATGKRMALGNGFASAGQLVADVADMVSLRAAK